MVFDTETNTFYFFDGTAFDSISNGVIAILQDADSDTKIEVEETADDDVIRFKTSGTEYFNMDQGRLNVMNTGYSVFIGEDAGADDDLTDSYNTGIGYKVLNSNTGHSNTAVGFNVLNMNSTGSYNTAVGTSSMTFNYSGNHNTAFGNMTLYQNSSGSDNVAMGHAALRFCNADSNTAVGRESLYMNQDGSSNAGFGLATLYRNTDGNKNTAIGVKALYNNLTGSNNIAIGYKAAINLSNDSNNIIIGYNIYTLGKSNWMSIGNLIYATGVDGTGTSYSSGNVGIGINDPDAKLDVRGSDVQFKNSSGNVTVKIDGTSGNSEIQFKKSGSYKGAFGYNLTDNYLYLYEGGNVVLKGGNFGIGTTTPGYRLQVGNSGDGSTARANSWNTFSDRKLKNGIVKIENPSEKLEHLNGYYYYWKEGSDKSRQVGVIAQEVEEVLPEIVSTDAEGIKSLDYSKLTPLLIEVLKEQQETIKKLEARIDALEKE